MITTGETSQLLLDNINKPKPKIAPPVQQAPPVTSVTQPAAIQKPTSVTQPAPTVLPQTLQPVQPTPAENTKLAVQPEAQKTMSYADFIQRTSLYKPMSDEEVAAQRRRQKRENMFAAIGDGISSLANLVATTKGAPSSYNPNLSLSKRYAELHSKIKAERDADKDMYYKQLLQARQLDAAQDNQDRTYRMQKEAHEDAADTNAMRRDLLASQTVSQQIENENKPKENEDKHNINAERVKTERTKQINNTAAAGKDKALGRAALIRAAKGGNSSHSSSSSSSDGKHSGQYTIQLADGTHHYNKDLAGAMIKLAPTMASKAKAAAVKYRQQGNGERARHYSELARAIASAKSQKQLLTYITENAWDFPSMENEVRSIIGAGAKQGFDVNKYARAGKSAPAVKQQKPTKRKPTDFE